jgi:hypothetical protein
MIDYVTINKPEREIQLCIPRNGCRCSDCFRKDLQLSPYAEGGPSYPETCTWNAHSTEAGFGEEPTQERRSENPLFFCPSTVCAFSLKYKSWKSIEVQHLEKVMPNEEPFKQLWMHPNHRKPVDSIVAAYFNPDKKNHVPDVINGKGRGVNILLHGGPGTGKTLTAGKTYISFPACFLELTSISIQNVLRKSTGSLCTWSPAVTWE